MDYKYNPIVRRTAGLAQQIGNKYGTMWWGGRYNHFEEPELPGLYYEDPQSGGLSLPSIDSLKARAEAMKHVERLGCQFILVDTPVGEVSATAWIRNIGYTMQHLPLVKEIAELFVWIKMSRLLSKRYGEP